MSHQQTISIIDDDESVRQALGSLVRSLGFAAALFGSAEHFIAAGAVADSAVVVTDVQMPGMTGIDLQERLRREGHTVPMIFITAFPEEALRKRAFAAGACCFLGKPFDGDVMIRCIEAALAPDMPIY
ncbi:response regulator transcription factor [Massilia sp.]|uniref:response regulator transcription factor n=1 Tax=Massilia sp. TaxID=1882437 RepID=UPI00289DAC51|nr:response regulator [Massilia sp.]